VDQLARQDAHLARLLAEIDDLDIWDHTTLMVVSDHGMTEVNEIIEVRGPLENAGINAEVISAAATATVFLKDPTTQPEALRVLRDIPEVVVYAAEDLPAELRIRHPSRNGDLMLITTPPRTFFQPGLLQSVGHYVGGILLDWKLGMHGYATDHPDMGAILLAMGRGVPKGVQIGPVNNIQVAPTIAKLLGIGPPAQAEGSPIPEFAADGDAIGRN
jgi:predicted AlkP superfamily pyrophosphatase or phosphodiesterase